jgi:hypothetical protein
MKKSLAVQVIGGGIGQVIARDASILALQGLIADPFAAGPTAGILSMIFR